MVRTEIEIHVGSLFSGRIEESIHFCGIIFDIAASLFLHSRLDVYLIKVLIGDEYGREELILEGNPVYTSFNLLFIVFGSRKIVCIVIGYFVHNSARRFS